MMKSYKIILSIFIIALISMSIIFGVNAQEKERSFDWMAQSAWSSGPGHHEIAEYFAKMINELSGGKLNIKNMYASGEIVGAFETIPAVASGKLDMTHSSGFYLTGTLPWISLIIGTQANYIKYPDQHLAWMYEGGGLELYQEYIKTKYDLIVLPTTIHASEPLWTTKPITSKDDFKGLKIRSTGLNMEFYQKLGASVTTMPMSEVVPSLERKVLDAAEFCVPYTDYPAGLHKVCPYALVGRIHLPEMFGLAAFINGDSWRELPPELQNVIKKAAKLTVLESFHNWNGVKAMEYSEQMIEEGLVVNEVSDELQKWFYEIGEEMATEYAEKDPWAKRILESQKNFIEKYDKYQEAISPYFRK